MVRFRSSVVCASNHPSSSRSLGGADSSGANSTAEALVGARKRAHRPLAALPLLVLASLLVVGCKSDARGTKVTGPTAGSSAGGAAGAGMAGTAETAGGAGSAPAAGSGGEPQGTGGAVAGAGGHATPVAGGAGEGGTETGGSGGNGSFLETGSPCDDDGQCGMADLCAAVPGAKVSTCRATCISANVGESSACAQGEVCAFDATRVRAVCQRLCSIGESGPEGCDAPDGCRLEPEPELTGGNAVEGLCVRLGDHTRGQRCQAGECAEGLECIAELGGAGYCEPHCRPGAASGEPMRCSAGEACIEGSDGRFGCTQSCSPFVSGGCDAGKTCMPVGGSDGLSGRCTNEGVRGQGERCSPGDCQAGLLCSPVPSPFAGPEYSCEPLCEVGDGDGDGATCGSGACVQAPTEAEGIGTCRESCAILEEGASAGCADGEWCAPATEVPNLGVCVPVQGQNSSGDECEPASKCAAGLYCECRFGTDTGCAGEAVCRAVCIPGAASTDPGGCPEDQACALEADQGFLYAFGTCRSVCDLASGTGCSDSAELCSVSAVAGGSSAVCLDVPEAGLALGEACAAPAFNVHEPCAAAGLCEFASDSGALVCAAVCRTSAGAVGSPNHPDCSDPAEVCAEIRPELGYGYCGKL